MSDSLWSHGLQHTGFPVHHQFPELPQTHVHRVGDAIQPSHALSSLSPPAFNLCQHQGLFQWVSFMHQVLPMNTQGWFLVGLTGLTALHFKELSRVSSTTVRKHQFFGAWPSLWSHSHIVRDYRKNRSFDYMDLCQQSDISGFSVCYRFVIAYLPRSKHLLISWLQSLSAVIFIVIHPVLSKCFSRCYGKAI